jgi:hypothetical protein
VKLDFGPIDEMRAQWFGLPPLTRMERVQAYYRIFAGDFPGPNKAAIAAVLANRMVELDEPPVTAETVGEPE